jgi:O-glycosyl hydrolase
LLLVTLDQALRERQLSARTSGPESWWPRRAAESWDMLDEAARRTMGHISTHGYGGGEGRAELRDRAQRAHLPVWISEYGDADASGLTLARQIVRDVRELQPSAWVYWQAVDAGGWGCIDLDMNKAAAEPRHNRKFDMFAQFTRHIRPGARMVGVSDESTVAALQSDRVVVVTVGGETDGSLRIDVSRVDTTGEPARVIRSSESEAQVEQPPVAAQQGSLRLEVPAKSVVTVVVPVRAVKPAEPNVGHGKAGAATTGSTPSL